MRPDLLFLVLFPLYSAEAQEVPPPAPLQEILVPVASKESLLVTTAGTGKTIVLVPGLFGSAFGYRHLLQLLSIKISQREGQSLGTIKEQMRGVTGDALEKRIAQSLAPALGAGAHAVAAADEDVPLGWRRLPVASGIEIHVREDSPAAGDDAIVAMREAVRSALGRENLR